VRPPEGSLAIGDSTRARERLGWRPQTGFDALIAEMVAADLAALQRG
jgi:GDPmannose 4,6-dehydratase